MTIQVGEAVGTLDDYARIPIAFAVSEVLDVGGDGPFSLAPRPVTAPYIKDYDADNRDSLVSWVRRFVPSRRGVIVARLDEECIGGAVVVYDTPEVDMLEGRPDLAVLWDLRILPARRRLGVGSALFRAVEAWATARGCRELKVETQNVNAVACRFYARQGCVLRRVQRHAYAEFPDEIQLLWYKSLAHDS